MTLEIGARSQRRPRSNPLTLRRLSRPDRVPRAPRRPPAPVRVVHPLSRNQLLARTSLAMLAALLFSFVANVTVFSQLQHLVAQQEVGDAFKEQLAAGTAPVSEGTFDDVLLVDGAPVGLLEIPSIGVRELIVEGTSSDALKSGPGHRRDTVLPGQAGVSVIMGRAAAFGGPFSRIQELAPGVRFSVRTGQGTQIYSVIGVRYAGDPTPAPPSPGQGRLVLETARGPAFIPSGVARVDAQLTSVAKPAGPRQTSFATLAPADKTLASDTSTIWALVFALQFLIAVEFAAVWTFRKVGTRKAWVVFVPVATLAGLFVTNQLTILLPNLL